MGIVLGPWNPNNQERQTIARVANVTTVVSGIVAVTTDMRQVRHAHANYTNTGVLTAASSFVLASVLQVSGAVVDVQFFGNLSGGPTSNLNLAPLGSGLMLSGGVLTVWAFGD